MATARATCTSSTGASAPTVSPTHLPTPFQAQRKTKLTAHTHTVIEFGTEVISLVFVDQSLLVHSESVSEHCVVNIPATATSGPALGILARFKDHVSEQAAQEIQEDMIRRVREQTHGRLPVQFRVLQKDEKFVWTFNMKPWRRLIVDAYFS